MAEVDVDGAFEWLVLIVGIVFGIMGSYPELFWGNTDITTTSETAVKSVVLPLVTSAVLWMIGKLLINPSSKLFVRLTAWMFTLSVTLGMLYAYLEGTRLLTINSEQIQAIISYFSLFIASPAFTIGVVLPRYRDQYPDASFFKNTIWLIGVLGCFVLLLLGVLYLSSQV
jgi:hypothetical protein